MTYAAKIKLVVAVVVAATVVTGGGVSACRVMAEDAPQPPYTAGQSDPARSARMWGEAKAGLACAISAEKTTYRPGEPIAVRFDLKNVSDKPATVWHCGFWPNHRWIVRDAAGRDLKLTERGRLCRDRYDDPRREKNARFVVQPGKLDASYGPYDLRRHFEIPEGNTIHVQCVYAHSEEGRRVEITSNTLTLTLGRPIAAEKDGVRFEALVTNRSDEVSETGKGGRTRFDLALRVTNLTGRALRFGRNRTTIASMKYTSDKTYVAMVNLAFHRAVPKPKLADYPLVAPGGSVTFNAYWRDSQLRLGNEDGVDGFWAFGGIERGEHELLLGYTQRGRDIEVVDDDGATVKIPKDQMWHGSVQLGHVSDVGPSIKVLLPGPPPDVRCGAIVERFWEIPDKASGKRTKVDMALRIENRTDRALYFSRYDTIRPKLKSASGKTYELGGGRNRSRLPRAGDYVLVQPGDGVTFNIDAHLYWHDDELRLGGSDGFGGTWFFRGLEPGNYGLYFQFTMPKSRLARDIEVVGDDAARVKIPRDQVWTGDKAAVARITLVEPGGEPAPSPDASSSATGPKTENRVCVNEDELCRKTEKRPVSESRAVGGLQAKISFARDAYPVGGPLEMVCELVNAGESDLTILSHLAVPTAEKRHYFLRVRLVHQGTGKATDLRLTAPRDTASKIGCILRSREKLVYRIDLGEWVRLKRTELEPGEYDVSAIYEVGEREHAIRAWMSPTAINSGVDDLKKFEYGEPRDVWKGTLFSNSVKIALAAPAPGVQCELIVPNRSWEIPDKAEGQRTKVDVALRVTNRTDRALYFSRYDTIWPTLKSTSGKSYKLTAVTKRHRKPTTADYALVKSGDSVTFPIAIATRLVSRGGQLGLGGETWSGAMWGFRGLEAGDYELAVRYIMPKSRLATDIDVLGEGGANVMIRKDEVWMGEVQSAPTKIALVEGGSKAVSTSDPTRTARSERNKTSDFLGPKDHWPQCRIVLEEIQPLFGGTAIYLDGAGPCVIRRVDRGREKRFRIQLSPEETLALRKLCIDSDLLTVVVNKKSGIPEETTPTIVLTNAKGETFKLAKWASDNVPRFDTVHLALLALRTKTEKAKPEYDGKWQREWKPPNPV